LRPYLRRKTARNRGFIFIPRFYRAVPPVQYIY
jgi:hypothetical protein